MTIMAPRTIEATYEHGLLRPLEPIQDFGNQVYLVTILNLDLFRAKKRTTASHSLRGKYRGYLSSADEFAANKQAEKALEL
jgi:predicted DNA-binding antitoxin AbrB/MazE fold protein